MLSLASDRHSDDLIPFLAQFCSYSPDFSLLILAWFVSHRRARKE